MEAVLWSIGERGSWPRLNLSTSGFIAAGKVEHIIDSIYPIATLGALSYCQEYLLDPQCRMELKSLKQALVVGASMVRSKL